MTRDTRTGRTVMAGCFVCGGNDAMWTSPNAQGVAARHHDATRHPTWCDVAMTIRYGRDAADDRQIDIETAIAAASSGERLVSLPLPDPDTPVCSSTDVSAPRAAQSRRMRSRPKPEASHA